MPPLRGGGGAINSKYREVAEEALALYFPFIADSAIRHQSFSIILFSCCGSGSREDIRGLAS